MKNRLIAAGAAVILAIGIYLGNLFQGLGLGEGDSGGETLVSLASNESSTPPDAEPRTDASASASQDALTLVVQKDGYAVQHGTDAAGSFAPSTLDDIIQSVTEAQPDTNGDRVRLSYSRHAEMGADEALSKRLQAPPEQGGAGLLSEEIIKVSGFVDSDDE